MPEFKLHFDRCVLDLRAIQLLEDLLRPRSIEPLRADAAELAQGNWHLVSNIYSEATATEYAEKIEGWLADGGHVVHEWWRLNDRDSIEHSGSTQGSVEVPWDRFEGYRSFRTTMRPAGSFVSKLELRIESAPSYRGNGIKTDVTISAEMDELPVLTAQVKGVLDEYVGPEPELERTVPAFKVFIGHGSDPQWKYLKRTLDDLPDMSAEAFESVQRAGYHTLVVVDQMVRSSSVAVVVMTGEDRMEDGSLRARENVVHEVGFCQGVLGIDRTIVVLEEGVSEPSNIQGLTQIRFPRGRLIDVESQILEALELRRSAHEYQFGDR